MGNRRKLLRLEAARRRNSVIGVIARVKQAGPPGRCCSDRRKQSLPHHKE